MWILALPTIFCLEILFDCKLQVFTKMTILGIFDKILSTQNVNVARFARKVKLRLFLWFSNIVHILGLKNIELPYI